MSKPPFIAPGIQVERTGSAKDYTTGRKGNIIEIDEIRERVRVSWHTDKNNLPIKIRTWVKWNTIALVRVQGSFDFGSQSPVQSPLKNISND